MPRTPKFPRRRPGRPIAPEPDSLEFWVDRLDPDTWGDTPEPDRLAAADVARADWLQRIEVAREHGAAKLIERHRRLAAAAVRNGDAPTAAAHLAELGALADALRIYSNWRRRAAKRASYARKRGAK